MAKDKSGFIIAAAFIGPGTVTTASVAGANYGMHLGWALLFSIIATMVLQDMAARLGLATKAGLAESIRHQLKQPAVRWLALILIACAIGVGNAAYESGNITGAAIGLTNLLDLGVGIWALIIGVIAAVLLTSGHYKLVESALVSLVGLMAVVFVVTFFVASPDWHTWLAQLFSPQLSTDTITTTLALIGTTIVPYNLFLHASLVADAANSTNPNDIHRQRKQSAIAIGLGGMITLVIMSTAMMSFFQHATTLDAANLAAQLTPLLGENAKYLFGVGLFAAGLTSAVTAPMATAYALCGVMNRPAKLDQPLFKGICLVVIGLGVAFASLGIKPLMAIVFAQAANGLLLPIIALFLIVVMNRSKALGELKNGWFSNVAGCAVVLLVTGLSAYKLWHL